jgi:hypothetical protein
MKTALISSMLIFSLAWAMTQKNPSHMPNPKLTPGAALDVTKDDLCDHRYESLVDSVPVTVKDQMFKRYNVRVGGPELYNIDHLIPTSLGGSNAIKNLWPQPLAGEWNYRKKNRLEEQLYKLVCRGELDLKEAQREIASDWVSAYRKYIGER